MDTLFREVPNIFTSLGGPKPCSSSRNLVLPGFEPNQRNPYKGFINPHPEDDDPGQPSREADNSVENIAVLKYISDMLMEEDLEGKTCMLQDCLALQAAEKPFYDVLGQKYPYSPSDSCVSNPYLESTGSSSRSLSASMYDPGFDQAGFGLSALNAYLIDSPESILSGPYVGGEMWHPRVIVGGGLGEAGMILPDGGSFMLAQQANSSPVSSDEEERDQSPKGLLGGRIHRREEDDSVEEERSNKHSAFSLADPEVPTEMFDAILLCPRDQGSSPSPSPCSLDENVKNESSRGVQRKGSSGRSSRGKKRGNKGDLVDLWTLLTQCAQALASSDQRTTNELLKQIKQHSSESGDVNQRLAHYFSIALEARVAGSITPAYSPLVSNKTKMVDILKAYRVYVKACPFKRMSFFYANRTILKQAEKATRIHIIDFGILYGFQWPCLIQRLSERSNGPPKLRITGIELPQPGFRPAERVQETVQRLKKYCARFNVPFEYHVIAKKWETIEYEDLNIDRDEMIVVNCLYRLKNIPDDTIAANSPRDTVLNLINKIKPDLFVHGVINGTYNAPFFLTRFREALFHFSSLFDMFEASVPREDEQRMIFERELFGRDILNVIACEGSERVERPETYKQWQTRTLRAGFRQLPLDRDILNLVRTTIKTEYVKDFVVDEDGRWLLQGWKGRITNSLSIWKPIQQ